MEYYISTQTIKAAYEELSELNYNNQSILHIFFILKGIGIDNLKYEDVEIIRQKGIPYAQDLGSLFSDSEQKPDKCEFINPFMMKEWGNNPTESLKKWVGSRIKNNVIGGATTWRKIVMQDSDKKFKFVYDYIQQIKSVTIRVSHKIPLNAIAIWTNRFTVFDHEVTINNLCNSFLDKFHFDLQEKSEFFTTNSKIDKIEYSDSLHDTQQIRTLIGNPSNMPTWEISKPATDTIDLVNTIMRRYNKTMTSTVEKDLLKRILNDYHQLILSGPPGTSKSYLCKELSKDYDECLHIQFHPQYSYQQFVGGYIVDKTIVKYETGVMLKFIDKAIEDEKKSQSSNQPKKYLVIIDEINRANTSQVFGDLIQCLDRGNTVKILCDGIEKEYYIPKNLYIVGTMNTTDRTIGALDYALKRRFLEVYCGSNPQILADLCSNNSFISLADFLEKINSRLYENLKNKEMCIGHAMFLNDSYKNPTSSKYDWDFDKFEILFNYKILPLVEEYCYGNDELVTEIVGNGLAKRLSGEEFKNAVEEFVK